MFWVEYFGQVWVDEWSSQHFRGQVFDKSFSDGWNSNVALRRFVSLRWRYFVTRDVIFVALAIFVITWLMIFHQKYKLHYSIQGFSTSASTHHRQQPVHYRRNTGRNHRASPRVAHFAFGPFRGRLWGSPLPRSRPIHLESPGSRRPRDGVDRSIADGMRSGPSRRQWIIAKYWEVVRNQGPYGPRDVL